MNKIAFFALMLALGLVGGCGNKKEEKKEEKDLARISQKQDKIEVKAAKVRLAPFEMELVSNGKVNARRKAVLAFITNDVVRKVHVKNGERVKKGDPIVSVDELKAGQQLEAARLSWEKAKLELRGRLMNEGINSLEDTLDERVISKTRLENIKLQIGYTSAAKEYEKAVYDYSNITVYAPFDGVIADLEVKEYNQSSAYKEVCSVIDDATMEIVFNVLETEIAHLKAGMEVEITPYANDKVTLKGTVTEVNPKIDENGMVKVRATTDNPEAVLVDGMNVSILAKRQIADQLITPVYPLETNMDVEKMRSLFPHDNFKDNYKVLNQEVRKFGINVPPLVNAYMSLSPKMRVFGTAINHEFGEVEETGILIAINEILEDKKKRHIETYLEEEYKSAELIRKNFIGE